MTDHQETWLIIAVSAGAIAISAMILSFLLPRGMAKVVVTIIASLIYVHWASTQNTELGTGGFVIWTPLVAFLSYWCAKTGASVVETFKS